MARATEYTALADEEVGIITGLADGSPGSIGASPGHLSVGPSPGTVLSTPGSVGRRGDEEASSQSINSSKGGGKRGSTTPSRDRKAWNPSRNTLLGSKMRYYSALRNQAAASPAHAGRTPGTPRARVDSFLAPPESVIPPQCESYGAHAGAMLAQLKCSAPDPALLSLPSQCSACRQWRGTSTRVAGKPLPPW